MNQIAPIMPRNFLHELMGPHERNRSSFYYVDRPARPDTALQLTCEALPHQSTDYNLHFRLLFDHSELGDKPRVRVRLEASNLRKPIEKFLAVSVNAEPSPFKARLEKMLSFRSRGIGA
jgi:hypothetical protein